MASHPAVEPSEGVRREIEEIVHYDHYDMSKYMSNERVIEYLYGLRGKTLDKYRHSYVGSANPGANKLTMARLEATGKC